MSPQDGYEYGLQPGVELLHQAVEHHIEEITFYGFTVDNCKRPPAQFQAFQRACVEAVDMITREGADLLVVGNTHSKCFPPSLSPYITRKSVHGGGIRLNFLVNYGWQWDVSHISLDGKPYSHPISRMDLIIRWGGMRRLSGFLPLQSVYSDFYVVDRYWPDYQKQDLDDALEWYRQQDVTLGG
jgi:undecaprenyl diphosphate synthase